MLPYGLYAIPTEQGADAHRCSRDKTFLAQNHTSYIYRSKAIDILVWRYCIDYTLLIDVFGQWQLNNKTVNIGIVIQEIDCLQQFTLTDFLRQSIYTRCKAHLST